MYHINSVGAFHFQKMSFYIFSFIFYRQIICTCYNAGGAYSAATGYKENDTSGHNAVAPSAYEDSYGVQQVWHHS